MAGSQFERWAAAFPFAAELAPADRARFARVLQFPVLAAGDVAYEQDGSCENYLMCIEGRTRIFKMSDAGREVLLYRVENGGTCVLTTQCLLSCTRFPAESIAEAHTELAAVPMRSFHAFMAEMPAFRNFVLANYTKLLGTMLSFIDMLAFATVQQRLARRLLVDAGDTLVVEKTHAQLAADIGSVREMVSRHLGEWERSGWISSSRRQIRILDRASLVTRQERGSYSNL